MSIRVEQVPITERIKDYINRRVGWVSSMDGYETEGWWVVGSIDAANLNFLNAYISFSY